MTSNLDSAEASNDSVVHPSAHTLLQAIQYFQKTIGDRPSTSQMVSALVHTEHHHRRDKAAYPLTSVLGTWRFRFGANRKSRLVSDVVQGSGFYVPTWIKATLAFEVARNPEDESLSTHEADESVLLNITNALQLGAVRLQFTGPAKYLPRRNLMAFDFDSIALMALGQTLYSGRIPGRSIQSEGFQQQAIAKLPFFAFIAATDDYIAARGRGGGLAVWSREAVDS